MDQVSLATAARIINEQPETLRGWRHRRLGRIAEIGRQVGRDLKLDVSEVCLLALVSAYAKLNQPLDLSNTLAEFFLKKEQERSGSDCTWQCVPNLKEGSLYAIQIKPSPGSGKSWTIAVDHKDLVGKIDQIAPNVSSISLLNITDIIEQTVLGWMIATKGETAARCALEDKLKIAPPERHGTMKKEFDQLVRRVLANLKTHHKQIKNKDVVSINIEVEAVSVDQ